MLNIRYKCLDLDDLMRDRNMILLKQQTMSDYMIEKLIHGHAMHECDLNLKKLQVDIIYDEHTHDIIYL